VQTGPTAGDSSRIGQTGATPADTVVCKDGSNAARSGSPCLNHGGIDWTATEAALNMGDSASADTALRAKPGVQTGPTDSSAAARPDSSGQ
jgi:hypothetical protein